MSKMQKFVSVPSENECGYIIGRYNDSLQCYEPLKMKAMPEWYAQECARILCDEYNREYCIKEIE